MKQERLLDAIGQVKEEYIKESAPKELLENQEKNPTKKNFRKSSWITFGALAACLCIIAGISMKTATLSQEKDCADAPQIMEETKKTENSNTAGMADRNMSMSTNDGNNAIMDTATTNTEPASAENYKTGDEGFPDWGLALSVKDVTSTGLTLIVTQSGGEPTGELQTGEAYRLISLVDETWKVVEELPLPEGVDGRGWNSIAYLIPKESSREFEINWNWIFGELPPGTYRLIKEFMDFRGTANYDTFEYWVEFEIQ